MFYTRYHVALIIMSRILTKEECLQLDIEIYNKAIELQWKTDKVKKNLSGDLSNWDAIGKSLARGII